MHTRRYINALIKGKKKKNHLVFLVFFTSADPYFLFALPLDLLYPGPDQTACSSNKHTR